MATNDNIIVKTELDFDFVANYNGEENTQNSHSSASDFPTQFGRRNPRNFQATHTNNVHQQQPQQNFINSDSTERGELELQKLLKEFNLEILYTTLQLGDITYRSLKFLTVEDINAVIRNIAYRAEFREKLFAWRRDKYGCTDSSHIPSTNAHRTPITIVNKPPPPTTIVAPTLPIAQTTFLNTINTINTTTTTVSKSDQINIPATIARIPATITERHNTPEDFLSLIPGVSGASTRISNMSSVVLEPTMDIEEALNFMPSTSKKLGTNSTTSTELRTTLTMGMGTGTGTGAGHLPKGLLIMSCMKVHVQNVMENTHIGRTIKQFYNKNGYFENQQRNEIVRLIIEEVMQQGESLSPKDFRAIMSDIITMFPNEKAAADYYFIYRNGKGNPLGRLYQRYSNENSKRRKLTRLAEVDDSSDGDRHSSMLDDDDTMSAYPLEVPGRVPRVDEMTALALKQLLTTEHFSWEEVCDKWIQTWALRQKELQQSGLAELLSNWVKLSDPRAAELFKTDFRYVYPEKENLLLSKWDDYVKKITCQFDKRINYEDIKKLYKFCKMGMASKDEQDFVYAIGLTALLPTSGRFRDHTGKLKIRANIGDSINCFVMRLNTLDAYESHLELYNRKYGPINRSQHPFLVVISPNEYNISKIYVALENRFYCMQSFLQALDLCYKIYHTCGLKYPTICENVWTFIQRYFYDMNVPWEARNANLAALIMALTMQS